LLQLHGSYQFKFYAVKLGNDLRLYGGLSGGLVHTGEANRLWSRQVDFYNLGNIVRLTDQGELFFQNSLGICRMRNQKTPSTPEIIQSVAANVQQPEHELVTCHVSSQGDNLIYEVSSPEVGLKEKLKGLFGRNAATAANRLHSVYCVDLHTQKRMLFAEALVEKSRAHQFMWSASPNSRFVVVLQPGKKCIQVEINDLSEMSRKSFQLPADSDVSAVRVTDTGTYLIELRKTDLPQDVLLIKTNQKNEPTFYVTPPRGYTICRLGLDFLVLHYPKQQRLLHYTFDNTVKADIDLNPLAVQQISPFFNVAENGDMNILLWTKGSLYINYSTVKNLIADGKRWHLMARDSALAEEQAYTREVIEQHQEQSRQAESKHLSSYMALDANREDYYLDVPSLSPSNSSQPGYNAQEPMRYEPSPVTESHPVRFELDLPSEPPRFAEPPTAPVTRFPATETSPPPAMEPFPSGDGQEVRPLSVLLESAQNSVTSLDFLSGTLLATPSTEDDDNNDSDDGPPRFIPPDEALVSKLPDIPDTELPTELPEPEPQQVLAASDLEFQGDPDLELERLRMLYIAGELSRADYHDKKQLIESYKARRERASEAPWSSAENTPAAPSEPKKTRRLDF
jgi:hypothetical protein